MSETAPAAPDAAPTMRVVAGRPTDEELAAAHSVIVAVLAERAARGAELIEPPVDRWNLSARGLRTPLAPGPGSWAGTTGHRGC